MAPFVEKKLLKKNCCKKKKKKERKKERSVLQFVRVKPSSVVSRYPLACTRRCRGQPCCVEIAGTFVPTYSAVLLAHCSLVCGPGEPVSVETAVWIVAGHFTSSCGSLRV